MYFKYNFLWYKDFFNPSFISFIGGGKNKNGRIDRKVGKLYENNNMNNL